MSTADIHPIIDSSETVEDCIRPSSFSCSFYQKGVSINELFEVSSLTFTNSTTYLHNQIRIISSQDEVALDQLPDAELVALCKRQLPDDIEAYKELLRRYEGLVYNFCLKTIGSPQDAEEVAQDALIQVFHKIHQFEGRAAFKTWLYKIVHNYCRNRISKIIRKRQAQEAYEDHVKKEQPSMEEGSSEVQDNKARIEEAMNHLKPKDKEIITYKFMLGMTLQEISDTLGVGSSAAKMRYYRAMESFKVAFERTKNHLPKPNISSPKHHG